MKLIKYILILLLLLAVAAFVAVKVASEDKPAGESGNKADALAQNMLQALDKEAFDSIPYLQFEFFRGGHKYLWDKKKNHAIIEWENNKVIMNLNTVSGKIYVDNVLQEGEEAEKIKSKAWSYWCNDSFWMIAPFKVFDKGTTRKIVELDAEDNGKYGLMIEYESGGVTPGDSYLWILDDNYIPTGWKMWTQILPVQGLYAGWSGWKDFGGSKLSIDHTLVGKEASMKNVAIGNSFSDFGYSTDPFNI